MTGKSCMIVAEWVLIAAAALNGALALKYSERTNHQWLFYFILSGRKAYIKNSKTWIRFVKKKKITKRSPQQTVLVVCPRSLAHSLSSIIGRGLWKAQKQFWGDPGCAFQKNLMSSGAWKTVGRGKQNLGGKRMGIPSAHHGAPSSGAYSEKLFSLSDGLGKVSPAA